MRVLVSTTPGLGHIHPLVPLAAALREAGHQVTWATGPESVDHVRRFGFDAVAAGMPVAERRPEVFRRNPHLNDLPRHERRRVRFPQTFAAVAGERMLRELGDVIAVKRPDVIVHEACELAAPVLAAATETPHVSVGVGGLIGPEMLEDDAVKALWQLAGLDFHPNAGLYDRLYLHPMPPSLQPCRVVPNAAPVRPLDAEASDTADTPEWLRALGRERPLVYATLGTELDTVAPLEKLRDAVAAVDADVVLTTGRSFDPASLAPCPPNVRAERYVPQGLVIQRAAAVVSQAGSGVTLAACRAGRPQVCIPLGADQFENTVLLERAGVGVEVEFEELTAAALGTAIRRALGDATMQAAAQRVAEEVAAMPPPSSYVGRIEALT